MIEYQKDDLLASPVRVIVHGVNCQGIMGAGIALAIKNKYPEVYSKYSRLCKKQYEPKDLLGSIQVVQVGFDELPIYVINAFTQNRFGKSGKFVV